MISRRSFLRSLLIGAAVATLKAKAEIDPKAQIPGEIEDTRPSVPLMASYTEIGRVYTDWTKNGVMEAEIYPGYIQQYANLFRGGVPISMGFHSDYPSQEVMRFYCP